MAVQQSAGNACAAACAARKLAKIEVKILPETQRRSIIMRAAGRYRARHQRGKITMKKLVLALGLVCATAFTAGSASAFPGSSGLIEALGSQNIVENVQYCRRGAYWCPGRISGCCPVGWACGSTTCYRSANRSSPAARSNKIPGR